MAAASQPREGGSADVLADVEAAEAQFAAAGQRLARELLRGIPFDRERRELARGVLAHRLENR